MPSDLAVFLRQLLRRPHQVVALAPSSRALCREMARPLVPLSGPVVELGGGTGKITRALIDAGVDEGALHVFELNPEFAALLQKRFPRAHVHVKAAQDIHNVGLLQAAAVISGLPLLSMPRATQQAIVGGAFDILRPGAPFVQFTYGPQPPIHPALRRDLRLTWTRSRRIWGNLPPARVYTFRQPATAPHTGWTPPHGRRIPAAQIVSKGSPQ